jgi:23S rRNA pseudouridine955/2504/2580 synthase
MEFDPAWIVHEDHGLLVVSKPAGLLTHATADKARENLVDLLRQARPDLDGLTLQHRLDRETSGLLLFTFGAEVRAGIAHQFADRSVAKTYLCWVRGKRLAARWSVEAPLTESSGRVRVGPGNLARTDFALVRRQGPYCLLQASPLTGRKHQIRAHLAHRGLPIVGDSLFGGEPWARLLLHAHRLEITHPLTGVRHHWEAEPGNDFRSPGLGLADRNQEREGEPGPRFRNLTEH